MAKYKRLKCAAHNWAHSFLSLFNFYANTFCIQELLDCARKSKTPIIEIDVLTGKIMPEDLPNPILQEFLSYIPEQFHRILEDRECSKEMIQSAILSIKFDLESDIPDLEKVSPGQYFADFVKRPELVYYNATITLTDIRGKQYSSKIPESWKY
jgi:hypothetical protein